MVWTEILEAALRQQQDRIATLEKDIALNLQSIHFQMASMTKEMKSIRKEIGQKKRLNPMDIVNSWWIKVLILAGLLGGHIQFSEAIGLILKSH
jgi:hypothetical protein